MAFLMAPGIPRYLRSKYLKLRQRFLNRRIRLDKANLEFEGSICRRISVCFLAAPSSYIHCPVSLSYLSVFEMVSQSMFVPASAEWNAAFFFSSHGRLYASSRR